MDRKQIIVNEIKYWKNNRLLPEQYCNFLLSLYTEGEEDFSTSRKGKSPIQLMLIIFVFIALAVVGLSVLVIYFTDFSTYLQTLVTIFFSMILVFLAYAVKRYDQRFVHLFILLAALLIFLATIHMTGHFFPNNPYAVITAVFITCVSWIFVGRKFKLKYFIASGVVGLFIALWFLMKLF